MADITRTVQNARGDVVLYILHEGKHTLHTFDAGTNTSYFETLTQTDEGVWAYLAVTATGPYSNTFSAASAHDTVRAWADTQKFADWLMSEF